MAAMTASERLRLALLKLMTTSPTARKVVNRWMQSRQR